LPSAKADGPWAPERLPRFWSRDKFESGIGKDPEEDWREDGSERRHRLSRRPLKCQVRASIPRWVVIMRDIVTLQCANCKNRNYTTTKNKKKTTERLEFKKFCNTCRTHTVHKETK
jgi:large subunit ribosomal protein L33